MAEETTPVPFSDLPLIDQLAARFPTLRGMGVFLAIDCVVDEEGLTGYSAINPDSGQEQSFRDPGDYAIARSLLYHAMAAGLDNGYFNLADPDRKTSLGTMGDTERDEKLSVRALDFLQSIRGTGVAAITVDVITQLIQTQLSLPEKPGIFGFLNKKPQIYDEFWNVDGRALTQEEEQIIREDLDRIVYVTEVLRDYVKHRVKQAEDPSVGLYFPDHRFRDGFIYPLGWRPKTALQRTQCINLQTGEKTDILQVLTNWWEVSFRSYYDSQGIAAPSIHFNHPFDRKADRPPLPSDVDFESREYLGFTGGVHAMAEDLYGQLFRDWREGNMGKDEIIAAVQTTQEGRNEHIRSYYQETIDHFTIFHLWAMALDNADWRERGDELDPVDMGHYMSLMWDRNRFATLVYEAMMTPDVYNALPPEIQDVIPFFASVGSEDV